MLLPRLLALSPALRPLPAPRCAASSPPPSGAAIITGGSGGIGFAAARQLAAKGADVVLAYGHNESLAAAACERLHAEFGVRAFRVGADLSTDGGRDRAVEEIFGIVDGELGGKVSYFVHAAGYFHNELLSHHFAGACSDFEVYDQYQSIYPKTFVAIAERCVERMTDGEGKMVVVTNPGCNHMQTPRVGYDMPGQGKAAMEFIVRMYAMRLAKRRICVNAVSPGYTDTKEWDKFRMAAGQGDLKLGAEKLNERLLSRSPMQRWAAPEEIGQAIGFLCSEQTGLITGVTLPVDGGLHLT
ncbi:hypothetical protein AB1Y20_004871 [Prymnesium parvum]|uniref:Uncharacterized protein n=1 Tax=Prymnesium parvum TaxID=97485 RepID=A0AB34J007_PRYPA